MRFVLFSLVLSSMPAFAFTCPAGAHLCSRPRSGGGVRNICVQFDGTKIAGYNDSPEHYMDFDFKHARNRFGCFWNSSKVCYDQWVKVTDSNVSAYKYTSDPDNLIGGSSYEYFELNLKTNRATFLYDHVLDRADGDGGIPSPDEYQCRKLTQAHKLDDSNFVMPPLHKTATTCGPDL